MQDLELIFVDEVHCNRWGSVSRTKAAKEKGELTIRLCDSEFSLLRFELDLDFCELFSNIFELIDRFVETLT